MRILDDDDWWPLPRRLLQTEDPEHGVQLAGRGVVHVVAELVQDALQERTGLVAGAVDQCEGDVIGQAADELAEQGRLAGERRALQQRHAERIGACALECVHGRPMRRVRDDRQRFAVGPERLFLESGRRQVHKYELAPRRGFAIRVASNALSGPHAGVQIRPGRSVYVRRRYGSNPERAAAELRRAAQRC